VASTMYALRNMATISSWLDSNQAKTSAGIRGLARTCSKCLLASRLDKVGFIWSVADLLRGRFQSARIRPGHPSSDDATSPGLRPRAHQGCRVAKAKSLVGKIDNIAPVRSIETMNEHQEPQQATEQQFNTDVREELPGIARLVWDVPQCDIHAKAGALGIPARVNGKTTAGPWANMCLPCFREFGVGLGVGSGQEVLQDTGQED
jgi:hypothetical protein